MADDEQFSLCWNNFNSNLSAGFHESLCRGDLVDVTLAAEGQFVKAHRLVLSVCSPYFRKMFTQMPANQHAFVFLKDVSHSALKDLIQFMYCGEVNVKQEALPAFISTAEALQIKGLTDSDPPPSQSPAEPSTPTPQIQPISSPRVRQRTSTSRSFKIESVDDSGDDNKQTQIVIQTTAAPPPTQQQIIAQSQTQHLQQQTQQSQTHIAPQQIASTTTATTTTVVSHKRPARSMVTVPHIKRTKSTIDPLDTADAPATGPQQITVQTAVVAASTADTKAQAHQQQQQHHQQSDSEYIDLPIELPTKSEPDYADDAGDVEGGENETTYVEDDSYGELRYDESYFTENDEAGGATTVQQSGAGTGGTSATTSKALVKQQQSSFTDTSYVDAADQANSDAQVVTLLLKMKCPNLEHYSRTMQCLNEETDSSVSNESYTSDGSIHAFSESESEFRLSEANESSSSEANKEKHFRQRLRCKYELKNNKKQKEQKLLRNSGLSYTSLSKTKKSINAKRLQPPCGAKCRLGCSRDISESQRLKIFHSYWKCSDLQIQREFLANHMEPIKRKYRYGSRRLNNAFFFDVNSKHIRVCKTFFKGTLDINDRVIRTVIKKKYEEGFVEIDLRACAHFIHKGYHFHK
ncbi:modifier of mdg4-like isoform X3 [Eurosta solidaginis]|uniref:modifier of mdg4-like isoform X3 n=1 Tax=Eurosta solidaginis TaxID=178769 RepID=UPI0035314C6E